MKREDSRAHPAPPATPTAIAVLAQVANKLRRAGASVPIPVSTTAPTIESTINRGLSIALCVVETELDALAAAAPRENAAHRALFSLPPIQVSASTALALPEMPTQKRVTGDAEIDAVLWLREVISTGNADLIAKAKEAAARIKTPLHQLEKRYTEYLRNANPGNPFATFSSFGFADLDRWIELSVTSAARRHEAQARFGDRILHDTPAEQFCIDALAGLERKGKFRDFDENEVDGRFDSHHEERPGTLTDCVLELVFWSELYWLRNAVDQHSDCTPEAHARQDYVFRLMSRIRPRDVDEAAEVFRYLTSNDGMDRAHTHAIILNLIGAPEPSALAQAQDAPKSAGAPETCRSSENTQVNRVIDHDINGKPIMAMPLAARAQVIESTADTMKRSVHAFDQWWAAQVEANGGVPIGADYRHWAKRGYDAGTGAAELGENMLSTALWLYRRLPLAYGRIAVIEGPIVALARRVGIDVADCLAERGPDPRAPNENN
jgi:hypothetical protein